MIFEDASMMREVVDNVGNHADGIPAEQKSGYQRIVSEMAVVSHGHRFFHFFFFVLFQRRCQL